MLTVQPHVDAVPPDSKAGRILSSVHQIQFRDSRRVFRLLKVLAADLLDSGQMQLPRIDLEGGLYVNSGNWMRGNSYVEIIDGQIELRRWSELAA